MPNNIAIRRVGFIVLLLVPIAIGGLNVVKLSPLRKGNFLKVMYIGFSEIVNIYLDIGAPQKYRAYKRMLCSVPQTG